MKAQVPHCSGLRTDNTFMWTLSNNESFSFLVVVHCSRLEKAFSAQSTGWCRVPLLAHQNNILHTTVEGYKCLVNVKLANDEEWPVSDVEFQQFKKVFLSAATGRFRSSFVECIGHFLLEIWISMVSILSNCYPLSLSDWQPLACFIILFPPFCGCGW